MEKVSLVAEENEAKHRSKFGFYDEYDVLEPQLYPSITQYIKQKSRHCVSNKNKCRMNRIIHSITNISILQWIRYYSFEWLKKDLLAGLTVSILLVPQSLAYSSLVGLPPIYGLYSSVIPIFVYSMFSTSTTVAIGPVAATAIMIASAVDTLITNNNDLTEYINICVSLTFMSGIILILLGLLKMGGIIVLLTRPVMTGFIMSAAFIILIGQFKSLLGLDISRYPTFYQTFINVMTNLDTIHGWTALIAIISVIILLLPKFDKTKKYIPKWIAIPLPLILIATVTVLSYLLEFDTKLGIAVVGSGIGSGFASPSVPDMSFIINNFWPVFTASFTVSLVSYMGSIALSTAFETKTKEIYRKQMELYNKYHVKNTNFKSKDMLSNNQSETERLSVDIDDEEEKYKDSDDSKMNMDDKDNKISKPLTLPPIKLNANIEFIAYGIANLIGSFFNTFIVSGSFGRSALNFEMEGHTQLSSVIQATVCLLCLLFLLPLLAPLPVCMLAAVIVVTVVGLIKNGIKEMKFLYTVSRMELIEFFVAFITPLFIGLEIGILIAMLSTIILGLYRQSMPEIVELGQIRSAASTQYVDIRIFEDAKSVDEDIIVIELRAELSYANHRKLIERVKQCIDDGKQFIIISLDHTQQIDTTTFRNIMELFEECKGVHICLAHCRRPVRELIHRYESMKSVNQWPFNVKMLISIHDSVEYCQRRKKELALDLIEKQKERVKTDEIELQTQTK